MPRRARERECLDGSAWSKNLACVDSMAGPVCSLADASLPRTADADRYSLITSDMHRLLVAGLHGPLRKTLDMSGRPPPRRKKNLLERFGA